MVLGRQNSFHFIINKWWWQIFITINLPRYTLIEPLFCFYKLQLYSYINIHTIYLSACLLAGIYTNEVMISLLLKHYFSPFGWGTGRGQRLCCWHTEPWLYECLFPHLEGSDRPHSSWSPGVPTVAARGPLTSSSGWPPTVWAAGRTMHVGVCKEHERWCTWERCCGQKACRVPCCWSTVLPGSIHPWL